MGEILAFFLGFGFWFWLVVVAELFFIACMAAQEKPGTGLASLLLAGLVLWPLGFNVFKWIYHHPIELIICTAVYFLIGIIWSRKKWKRFCLEKTEDYKEVVREFIDRCVQVVETNGSCSDYGTTEIKKVLSKRLQGVTDTDRQILKETWLEELRQGKVPDDFLPAWQECTSGKTKTRLPSLNEHKAQVITWVAYWPFSFLGYMLLDVLEDIAKWFVNTFKNMYERVTLSAYKKNIDPRLLEKAPRE